VLCSSGLSIVESIPMGSVSLMQGFFSQFLGI
jgi:hypothetical protein